MVYRHKGRLLDTYWILMDIPRKGRAVYFHVQQVKNPLSITTNDVVKYDDVTLNNGNHYNPSSGIFTAPVKGIYQFMANMMVSRGSCDDIVLWREGKELARGGTGCQLNYGTGTINTIARLEKGDHVWLTKRGNTPVSGLRHSRFSGFLLFK